LSTLVRILPGRAGQSAHVWALLVIVLVTSSLATASAQCSADIWGKWKIKGRQEHKLALHEERLKSSTPEEWLDYDVQAYLGQAMWVVYYAYILYCAEHEAMPTSHELLVEDGYLAEWPGNPADGWRPMRMLHVEDGFSPGDFCLQICPPEYYSRLGGDEIGPYSFELSVYAANEKQALAGSASPLARNAEWALTPDGVLFMAGYYREPAPTSALAQVDDHSAQEETGDRS
jgi:hypothetical protein